MKKIKYFLSLGVAVILAMAIGITCFAAESNFSDEKKFVDSNDYTYITSAVKDDVSSTPEVKITAIYDANKNDSNYKQIYVKGTSLGTGVLVTKGSWVEVPIPSGSSIKGNNILLYGKGHNPSLDCYVSGYWNVH